MLQHKSKKKLEKLEHQISLLREYTRKWEIYFNMFTEVYEGAKITAENEAQFFRLVTDLARHEYRVSFFVPEFEKSKDTLELLASTVSLSTVQEMSENGFNKIQHTWHVIFIHLHKVLGRLEEKLPPPEERNGKSGKKGAAKAQARPADPEKQETAGKEPAAKA